MFTRIQAAAAAALVGAAFAWMTSGLAALLRPAFDAAGVDRWLVVLAIFWSAALGISLPQRLALRAGRTAWERFGRAPSTVASDQCLQWLAVACAALLGGLFCAALPWLSRGALEVRAVLYEHFVWSLGIREALHFGMAVVVAGPPALCVGLAITCAHHVHHATARWSPVTTAWAMLGAGAAAEFATVGLARPETILLGAALPLLIVAVVAGLIGTRPNQRPSGSSKNAPTPPEHSDRRPRLLRAGVTTLGVVLATTSFGLGEASRRAGWIVGGTGFMLMIAAVSFFAGARWRRAAARDLAAFGLASVIGGLAFVFSALLIRSSPFGGWAVLGAGFATTALVGFATGAGMREIVESVADRGRAGAKSAARVLVYSTLSIGIVRWIAPDDAPVVIVGFAGLASMAVGVVIVFRESAAQRGGRGWRGLLSTG